MSPKLIKLAITLGTIFAGIRLFSTSQVDAKASFDDADEIIVEISRRYGKAGTDALEEFFE